MDGAEACYSYPTPGADARLAGVGGREGRDQAAGVTPGGTAFGADLGGSSEYSNENFEGRSGERFRANGDRTRVSRS